MVFFPDPRARHPYHMHDMIRGQPEFVAETLRRLEDVDARDFLRTRRRAVVTGCGTSFHAATYGARVLHDARGDPHPAEAVHAYDLLRGARVHAGDLVIGVSHSGNTPTTNRALRRAHRLGARVVALAGLRDTPMERVAERTVILGSTHDGSWANTMSYTTQLAALARLACRVAEGPWSAVDRAVDSLPATLRRALACEAAVRRLAGRVAARGRVTFLGADLEGITAQEAALKIRETCSLPASAYHPEQILHGPFLSLDRGEAVVAVRHRDDGRRVEGILDGLAATGAFVATVGDAPQADIRLPALPRILRPIASVVPLQFLAYYAALARRANPDIMRADVPRYQAGLELLFTGSPARAGSGRPSRPRGRSAGGGVRSSRRSHM